MGVVITQAPHFGTDVGGVDSFIAEGDMLGNPTDELAWINSLPGLSGLSFATQTENVDYFYTDMAYVFAFQLQSASPGYFLIKNAQRVALYQNAAAMDWGVFDVRQLSSALNLPSDDFQISHVTEVSGSDVNVPEPSVLALLGLGLIGIYTVRRGQPGHQR
jgi:hypothetical protein